MSVHCVVYAKITRGPEILCFGPTYYCLERDQYTKLAKHISQLFQQPAPSCFGEGAVMIFSSVSSEVSQERVFETAETLLQADFGLRIGAYSRGSMTPMELVIRLGKLNMCQRALERIKSQKPNSNIDNLVEDSISNLISLTDEQSQGIRPIEMLLRPYM
jgi:hypothetical protein